MGILRVYLALCVIHNHAEEPVLPWPMHWGFQAVQIFYIISGFYMAMVLSSARYQSVKAFYLSRFMRVFLPYWLVATGVVGWSTLHGLLTHNWLALSAYVNHPLEHNGLAGLAFVTVSNLTLFGQDWVMFLSQDHGKPFAFTANSLADPFPLWHYLVVPQCWSIGVEVTFYAMAPYLNRLHSGWLGLIAVAACAFRFAVYAQMGGPMDPWHYRFFPFEIALFIFGMLAFRLYARTKHLHPHSPLETTKAYLIAGLGLLAVLALHVPFAELLEDWIGAGPGLLLSDGMWALALPVLFVVFGNKPLDRMLGELSYPMYLVHVIIIDTFDAWGLERFRLLGLMTATVSILISLGLYFFYIAPLDRKRHILTVAKPEKLDALDKLTQRPL